MKTQWTCPQCGSTVVTITQDLLATLIGLEARTPQINRETALLVHDFNLLLETLKTEAAKLTHLITEN